MKARTEIPAETLARLAALSRDELLSRAAFILLTNLGEDAEAAARRREEASRRLGDEIGEAIWAAIGRRAAEMIAEIKAAMPGPCRARIPDRRCSPWIRMTGNRER